MENSFQTSFIPKKPLNTNDRVVTEKAPVNFFTVLSFIILLITVLAFGGLFFYKKYVEKQIKTTTASLASVRSNFDKDAIANLEVFDKRINAAGKILDGHIVFSPMFDLIGSITIPSIQYTKFTQQSTENKIFSVKMSGLALNYKSIAIQSDIFNTEKGRYFKNVVFSNLAKEKDGRVKFDVEFIVDPSLLSYKTNLQKEKNYYNKKDFQINNNLDANSQINPNGAVTPATTPVTNTPNLPGGINNPNQ